VRKQLTLVAVGTLIAYAGGSTNFFLWYNIPVPPVFNFLVTFYVAFIAYAILHYKLWDIEFIVRKTLVFAGLLGFFAFLFLSLTYFANVFIGSYVGLNANIASFVTFGIGILFYPVVERFLVNLTDKHLFQKKYDYQKVLKDASRGMSRIESLDHLLKLVIHFVTMRVRVRNAAAVIYSQGDKDFYVAYTRGYLTQSPVAAIPKTIPTDSPLIRYLATEHEALDSERIKELIETGRGVKKKGEKRERQYDFRATLEDMQKLHAACVVPSFLGKELRSILVLGEKKSGDVYTDQDLNFLYTLAQESAIAIENARLFDEAVNKSRELERINEELAEASKRLGVALANTEEANKRLRDTQAQLIHEQKMATLGRLAASVGHEVNNPLTILSMNVSRMILRYRKDPTLKVADVTDFFSKMEANIQRIKAVVNTLTGLLKRSEKGKFEPLSLKLVIEETLPLVQFQTYLDNLTGTEVDFDVPPHIPLIKGDLERLQEVFLNLFTNAYHAMDGKQPAEKKIRVTAYVEEANPKFVTVEFGDNGCGMDEETMQKMFNYGFTTKGEGKGSGIGVYMCRYIVELHGGEIKVRSKKGEGTTFTLTLPIYEEQRLFEGEPRAAAGG
jgi:signal transduction histidine kinase